MAGRERAVRVGGPADIRLDAVLGGSGIAGGRARLDQPVVASAT